LLALILTTVVEIVVILASQVLADARMPADAVAQRRDRAHAENKLKPADFVQELGADVAVDVPFARHPRADRLGEGKQLLALVDRPGVGFD
jgi:hypothetical protein